MATKAKKKLRVGFAGAGGIARHHMNFFKKMEDVELVAVSDVSDGALQQVQKDIGVTKLYKSWQEMLAKEELDAVDVCTPNGLHAPATIDALKAGCHVLVEKPLAMNAVEGAAMLAAAKKAKKHLIIGFQWRYSPQAQLLKQAGEAGQFGNIMFMRCEAMRRRGIPNWGVFGRKDLQGGGPMIDIGVHIMEMAHFVMGEPTPVAASGNIYTYMGNKPSEAACSWPNWDYKTYTVEDLAIGHIRFANGAIMHVQASFAAHCEDKWNFTFMGEKGGGNFDPLKIYRDQDGYMLDIAPGFVPKDDMFAIKMRKFVDTALYDAPTIAPATAGLMVQKMIDGIYASAAAGKEVAIK